MIVHAPHFLLYSESIRRHLAGFRGESLDGETWRFVLKSADGSARLEAADREPDATPDRLELLAVVRGLEALDQPSRVTLVTPSRYVSRGIRFGLEEWRNNGWQWERFGRMAPVKNGDLWQRIDRALRYHQLHCRTWRIDAPEDDLHGSRLGVCHSASRGARSPIARHARGTSGRGGLAGWFSFVARRVAPTLRRLRCAVTVARRSDQTAFCRTLPVGGH